MPRNALTWFLASAFFGLLLLVSGCAIAPQKPSLVFQAQDVTVTLFDEPCRNKVVLENIRAESRNAFRAAAVVWQGDPLAACWATLDDSHVFIMDETGDNGAIPMSGFKRGQ